MEDNEDENSEYNFSLQELLVEYGIDIAEAWNIEAFPITLTMLLALKAFTQISYHFNRPNYR